MSFSNSIPSLTQLKSCLFLVLVLCSLSVPSTSATHTPGRAWHSPCSNGAQSTQMEGLFQDLGEPVSDEEIARHQFELSIELGKAVHLGARLSSYITRRRFLDSTNLITQCQTIPSLMGMPQIEANHLFVESTHSTLPYDFRRLATLAVFVDVINHDSNQISGYRRRSHSLLAQIRKSMCLMEVIALSRGQTIARDITEDVMPTMYRNMPHQGVRDTRNCLIVRDAVDMISNIHNWYSQWQ